MCTLTSHVIVLMHVSTVRRSCGRGGECVNEKALMFKGELAALMLKYDVVLVKHPSDVFEYVSHYVFETRTGSTLPENKRICIHINDLYEELK